MTLNQRVARLEDDMVDVKTLLKQHSTQINGMQTQINGMQTQINNMHQDLSAKIDKLTELFVDHIKNHK